MAELSALELLLRAPFLAGVDADELQPVASQLERLTFTDGEAVLAPGQSARGLYLVASGAVELWTRVQPDGHRVLARLHPGDCFAEENLAERPLRAPGARAAEASVAYRWNRASLRLFLKDHPSAADGLRLPVETRRLARAPSFPWIAEDEALYAACRKHPAVLARSLLVPSALVLTGLIWLSFRLVQGGSGLPLVLAALLTILGAAFFVWQWADWRNDYYVVTDRRVVWLEKVIGLYDSRQESPLGMILSVSLASDLTSRLLRYADVVIRSYTGSLVFRQTAYAATLAALIEELRRRQQAKGEATDRLVITQALRQRLEGEATAPVPPPRPAVEPERSLEGVGLDHWTLQLRFEVKGVITYRKHWAVLIQAIVVPALLFVASLGLALAGLVGLGPSGWSDAALAALGAAAVAAGVWGLYEFADWANDLYQITPTHIVDVHKKPLGREVRKLAPLENILGTEVDRHGPVGVILNFGNVIATVGTSEFRFEGILNPSAAQQDIVRAQEALVERKRSTERRRRQDEMVEWLTAYHDHVAPPRDPGES
jgi:hypothetical protein